MNSQSFNQSRCATGIVSDTCANNAAERQRDVPEQLDSLDSAVSRVECAVKHLHQRIQSAIRPPTPEPGMPVPSMPVENLCEVADRIRGRVNNLHAVADALEYLAREVQL